MDPIVNQELKIRRRLDNIFNKQQDEFTSKKDFDDYLETKETYVFNLLLGEEVAETEAKIAEYQRVNQESIARNKAAQAGIQNGANAEPMVTAATIVTAPAQTQGYIPSARAAAAGSAMPVPCTNNYTEGPEGELKVQRPGNSLPSRDQVAAASGWNRRAALLQAFKSAKQFWVL